MKGFEIPRGHLGVVHLQRFLRVFKLSRVALESKNGFEDQLFVLRLKGGCGDKVLKLKANDAGRHWYRDQSSAMALRRAGFDRDVHLLNRDWRFKFRHAAFQS
jgi:hypothetical protein